MPHRFSRRLFIRQLSAGYAATMIPWALTGCRSRFMSIMDVPHPPVVLPGFHLTARTWRSIDMPAESILDAVEGMCRFSIQHQNEEGAIIDPFLNREHQYATPYFAHAMGTVLHAGRARELADHGIRAMDKATADFERGHRRIPDGHGEFFIAPLTLALDLYKDFVDAEHLTRWRNRLSVDVSKVMLGLRQRTNNWRTYPMKGEWLRYEAGLVSREEAVDFIEDGWLNRSQRERIAGDMWGLYQDWSSHRQSHAVEAVGRGNLVGLIAAGYDGPSADEIRDAVERGCETSLWLQDPTGQCPPNGRPDDHVFNDVLYQLIFEVMAERAHAAGNEALAGKYRRAATLAFQSILRWQRKDADWAGSFYVTKNFFDPADRVGYQPASQYTNYNGAVMYHLAEAYHARQSDIEEQPAPCEVGGFVRAMDPRFGSVVANAGGMQVFVNLKGDTVPKYDIYWTPLGVVRFSRSGWESRLGPSDGVADYDQGDGMTFGPTIKQGNGWKRLASMAKDYEGTLRVDFEHPLIIKFTVVYAPITGSGGPIYYHDFVVTPDGVMTTLSSPHEDEFGLTLPLLENDGQDLDIQMDNRSASTRYRSGNGDEQHFLVVNRESASLEAGESMQSTYGWLKPARVTADAETIQVFVYPRTADDPDANDVLNSFEIGDAGFSSVLGRLEKTAEGGTIYIGRTAAGGYGTSLNISGEGPADLTLTTPCNFIVQHEQGQITALEADVDCEATIAGQTHILKAFTPIFI